MRQEDEKKKEEQEEHHFQNTNRSSAFMLHNQKLRIPQTHKAFVTTTAI